MRWKKLLTWQKRNCFICPGKYIVTHVDTNTVKRIKYVRENNV